MIRLVVILDESEHVVDVKCVVAEYQAGKERKEHIGFEYGQPKTSSKETLPHADLGPFPASPPGPSTYKHGHGALSEPLERLNEANKGYYVLGESDH